ncbi:MAG: Gfo/Idh/MocA family oxidoreductase [Spirochaetaceae bacterium]|jgi:predicted dehydrogenase|nr:Gfo/Idh/MocA family oxidoreductase [Spirochaetaceae bacterium]
MLNIAVIGTGNIARMHIDGYLAFPERCRITHLADIYPEKAVETAAQYGLQAKTAASYQEFLDEPIDLVSICTPPYCHAEASITFLDAGKNVLVEKPMAASLEECDAMIAAAKRSGKVFSVVAQNRFRDPIYNLKKTLDTGLIGRVVHAQIDSFWNRGHSYYDLWWRGTWEKEGGGCTLNHAVHHIDMLGWMLGLPEQVSAMISNANHDNAEVEDISVAALRYGKSGRTNPGALAQITASVIHHGEEQQVIFQGEKARISAPWKAAAQMFQENGFPVFGKQDDALVKKLTDFYEGLPHLEYSEHTGQIDNVLTAIETGGEPLIKGGDGRLTIELITAIYKAGSEGRTVSLPIGKDDPFYTVPGIMRAVPHFYEKTTSVENFAGPITVGSDYQKSGAR